MELRQLRYFSRVAELGSFRAAAETMHVSQPALSQQVRRLEERLGTSLLMRHARGVSLTPEGRVLLDHAKRILRAVAEAEDAVAPHAKRGEGTVRLGVTPTMSRVFVPDLIRRCGDRHPAISLGVTEGVSDELTAAVGAGRLDIAFSYNPDAVHNVESTPLLAECLYFVGMGNGDEGNDDEIAFARLRDFPLILANRMHSTRQIIDRLAEETGVPLTVKAEIEATALKRQILIGSEGYALVPYGLFSEEIECGVLSARKVVNPAIRRTLYLVRNRDKGLSAAGRTVSGMIGDLARDAARRGDWRWEPVAAEEIREIGAAASV